MDLVERELSATIRTKRLSSGRKSKSAMWVEKCMARVSAMWAVSAVT